VRCGSYIQRMRKTCALFLVICPILFSCASSSEKEEEKKPVEPVSELRLAGRVQSVNQASRFVLIRRYGFWRVAEGEIVESRGEGRTANLLPSGEKLGEHIAADIRSGHVEVGDAVYIRKIKPAETPKKETPEKVKTSEE